MSPIWEKYRNGEAAPAMQENAEGERHDAHSSEEGSSTKVRGGVRSLRKASAELGIVEFG
ncbi:hypothetical protein MSC49_21190 [Methylosinus sp. C49]|nr:hypothetical protein MSC49_21190 [Methylosinus sp. C49]